MPEDSPSPVNQQKRRITRILRLLRKIVLWLIAGILFLFLLIVILIQVPAVQNFIKNKAVAALTQKLKTKVEIGHISLKLNGGIKINHIYIADDKRDTLLFTKTLSINVNPLPLFHKRVIFSSISLSGTRFKYTIRDTSGATNIDFITKAFADTSKTKKPKKSSWQIDLRNLQLNDVGSTMSNKADSSLMKLLIGSFEINLRKGNIQQMDFDVRNVRLENTSVAMTSYKRIPVVEKDTAQVAKKPMKMVTAVNEITLKNISFSQIDSVSGSRSKYFLKQAVIRPDRIDIPGQTVSLKSFQLKKGFAFMNMGNEASEKKPAKKKAKSSGIHFSVQNARISLDSIHLVNNSIPKDSAMGYLGDVSISAINVNTNAVQFSPDSWKGDISKVQFTDDRTGEKTTLQVNASSDNRNIILKRLGLQLGKSQVNCKGDFAVADTGKGKIPDFHFTIETIRLYKADLLPYIPKTPSLKRFKIPADILFNGNFSSVQQKFKGEGRLQTELGTLIFNADVDQPASPEENRYNITASVKRFDAGAFLNDTSLGTVTARVHLDGSGMKPETMNTKVSLFVDSIFMMKRTYRSIGLDGTIAGGRIDMSSKINDEVVKLRLALNGSFKNNLPRVNIKADITHLDLHAMGFMKDTMTISGFISASYNKYSDTRFELYTDTAVVTVATPQTKLITHTRLDYYAGNDTVDGYIRSNFGTFTYQGNIGADKLPALLKQYFSRYYTLEPDTLVGTRDKYFVFQLALNDLSAARELIPVNLSIPDGGNIQGQLLHNKLTADVKFKQFMMNTLKVDTINLHVEGSDSALNMAFTAASFVNSIMVMKNIDIRNVLNNGQFNFRVKFENDAEKPWFNFGVVAKKDPNGFRIRMQEPMVMDFIPWTIDRNNEIVYSKQGISLRNVSLSYKGNGVAIQNINNNPDALSVAFHNMGLSLLSQMLKGDSTTIAGKLNGTLSLFSLKAEKKKFAADIGINSIRTGNYQMGDFTLTASNAENPDRLNILMKLVNSYMNLNAEGFYGMQETQPSRITITANNLDLAGFAAILNPEVEDLKGKVNASIQFTGTPKNPNLQGNIRFTDVGLRPAAANTPFGINNQEIRFEGKRIHFPDFKIQDADGNPMTINGDVIFNDLKNISYQMHVASQDFLAYDAYFNKQLDKESKVILTSDINITGDMKKPVVKATVSLGDGSKIYYEMGNRGGDFSEDGVIEFVGAAPPKQAKQNSLMQNLSLTANVTLPDGTPVTIMTDPAKGDLLHVKTGGRLSISQRPLQSPRMIGKLDISDGDYTMTLAGFKKTFTLEPKSSISWNGDIASPEFNLIAYYEIRTSPAPLFPQEAQTGVSQMPNALPFRVGLTLTGTLAKPEINFDLSLPQEYQDAYADVTTKLQQINSDPSEVNKQAMFLVLFGTFDISKFTDPSNLSLSTFSTMSNSGGTNALISRTLNQFAAQQIKFVTLHFDLQSYDNLGGTTAQPTRTELDINASRKFIDNRLDTRVGGNIVLQADEEEQKRAWYNKVTPIFNLQYMFNKPRTWGIKFFRQEDYRGILEGKVGSLGAGVIFQKDYENLKDLLKKTPAGKEGNKQTLADE